MFTSVFRGEPYFPTRSAALLMSVMGTPRRR